MASIGQFFQWQTMSGEPIKVGETTITPQSRVLVFRFPYGGFVWNRPTAVLVERAGQSERIAIVDRTRIALVALSVLGFIFSLILRQFRFNEKESESQQ